MIPQTSTIASHLPRAVGRRVRDRARRGSSASRARGRSTRSSSARSATRRSTTRPRRPRSTPRRTSRTAAQPLPLLFVCEDNGLGISVPTPEAWIEQSLHGRPELAIERADGERPGASCSRPRRELAAWVREHRHPAVLHLRTVRFLSHAGADLETAYRSGKEIRADYARDPLLALGRWLVASGGARGEELAAEYLETREPGPRARTRGDATGRRLATAEDVMRPLAPRDSGRRGRRWQGAATPTSDARLHARPGDQRGARRRARAVPRDARVRRGRRREGRRLRRDARPPVTASARAACSTRSSTRRRSSASRSALRSRASSRSPRSSTSRTSTTPRISSAARRRRSGSSRRAHTGTGWSCASRATATRRASAGTSTTTTRLGVLRDMPGLVIASPARPADVGPMLRTCVAAAKVDGTVSVFLEPIALYHDARPLRRGRRRVARRPGRRPRADRSRLRAPTGRDDLTIVSVGERALHVASRRALACASEGIGATVVDLRWLAPLPIEEMLRRRRPRGRMLVVDETRRTGGVGEGIVAELVDAGYDGRLGACDEQGLVRPAGRRGKPRAPLGGRDRGSAALSGCSTSDREGTRAAAGHGRPPAPPTAAGRSRRGHRRVRRTPRRS